MDTLYLIVVWLSVPVFILGIVKAVRDYKIEAENQRIEAEEARLAWEQATGEHSGPSRAREDNIEALNNGSPL